MQMVLKASHLCTPRLLICRQRVPFTHGSYGARQQLQAGPRERDPGTQSEMVRCNRRGMAKLWPRRPWTRTQYCPQKFYCSAGTASMVPSAARKRPHHI